VLQIFAYQVNRYERSWLASGSVSDLEEWNQARYWATLSSKLNDSHPDYLETMGRLYYWRFFVSSDPINSLEEQNAFLNQGLVQFRQAIAKRPTWPQTWARLLKLKSIVGNVDEEYWYAWDNAQSLGRWEIFVQEELLASGLQHWDNFNLEQQGKVMSVLIDMSSKAYSEPTASAIVTGYGKSTQVCSRLSSKQILPGKHMSRICSLH